MTRHAGWDANLTRHTEYFEEGNQVKIADKRAANKKLMQLESARRRLQTQQARPVTTRSRLSFPTNLVERVGHEKHLDKAAVLQALWMLDSQSPSSSHPHW